MNHFRPMVESSNLPHLRVFIAHNIQLQLLNLSIGAIIITILHIHTYLSMGLKCESVCGGGGGYSAEKEPGRKGRGKKDKEGICMLS